MRKLFMRVSLLFLSFYVQGEITMNIAEMLRKIEKEVIDLTVIWDLKRSASFELLENSANEILEESLVIFQSRDINIQQKQILIYALQNAEFSKYKKFLNELSLLYIDGKIDEFIMYQSIMPYDWNYAVRKNFKDKEIKEVLNRCLQYEKTSVNFKKVLKSILSGKARNDDKKQP